MNFRALDSATKYPPIPTYHSINSANGLLSQDEVIDFGEHRVHITEKIDGTNARIILLPGSGYIIGSRSELLTHSGDKIYNPALGIVDHLRPIAERLDATFPRDEIFVFYGEVYGGNLPARKQYATDRSQVGFRAFDISFLEQEEVLDWPLEKIAAWRDGGGQRFHDLGSLVYIADRYELDLVPTLGVLPGTAWPTSFRDTLDLMLTLVPSTFAHLADERGDAEGLVVRTEDRRLIAKLRFEDYQRTLRKLKR